MATADSAPNVPMSFTDRVNDFVSRLGIAGKLLRFLWTRKLWWLILMIIALLVLGLLLVLGASGALAPQWYTAF